MPARRAGRSALRSAGRRRGPVRAVAVARARAIASPIAWSAVTRSYVVRTFGCQMNEHDSERIAGLLEADGYVAVTDEADADVVVLNTCCIRENADNKLYGTLGQLKPWKAAARRSADRRRRLPGAEGPRPRSPRRRRTSTSCSARTTCTAPPSCSTTPATTGRSPRSSTRPCSTIRRCSPVRCRRVARPRTTRGSPSRSAATTRARSASCRRCAAPRSAARSPTSSPRSQRLAAEGVSEVTLLGQNVNSYGRDLQLAARQAGDTDARLRPLFAELLTAVGAVDGIRRVRFTSPHPKDMRPETFAAMAATPAVCEHLHYPLQSGSDRVLAAMHRGYTAQRYLDRLAAGRAALDDLAVSTDIIVGFPGETDDDFAATLEVAAAAEYDYAYTFVFSPRPGTEAADDGRPVRRAGRCGRAVRAAARRRRAQRAGQAPGSRRPGRGGARRGSEQEGSRRAVGPHAAEQAGALHPAAAVARRRVRDRRDHPRGAAPPHRRVRRVARPSHCTSGGSPFSPGDRADSRRWSSSARPRRARATWRWRSPARHRDVELVAVDAMQVYRRMDIGTAKPSARRPRRRAAPLPRPRRRRRRLHRDRLRCGGGRSAAAGSPLAIIAPCWSPAPACTCAA